MTMPNIMNEIDKTLTVLCRHFEQLHFLACRPTVCKCAVYSGGSISLIGKNHNRNLFFILSKLTIYPFFEQIHSIERFVIGGRVDENERVRGLNDKNLSCFVRFFEKNLVRVFDCRGIKILAIEEAQIGKIVKSGNPYGLLISAKYKSP
uniref:Uncharacterized protein n=1 Tax=Caenorhabditis japonica TaxID=281687 RepID=A0A8R1ENP8_CAEJA